GWRGCGLPAKNLSGGMRPRRGEAQAQIRSRVGQASETGQIVGCPATEGVKYKNRMFYMCLSLNNVPRGETGSRVLSFILWHCTGDFVALHKIAMILCLYLKRSERASPLSDPCRRFPEVRRARKGSHHLHPICEGYSH